MNTSIYIDICSLIVNYYCLPKFHDDWWLKSKYNSLFVLRPPGAIPDSSGSSQKPLKKYQIVKRQRNAYIYRYRYVFWGYYTTKVHLSFSKKIRKMLGILGALEALKINTRAPGMFENFKYIKFIQNYFYCLIIFNTTRFHIFQWFYTK